MRSHKACVLAALLLLIPCVAMLWVTSYNKAEPAWLGIPFFYWYQLLWVPVSAIMIAIANNLLHRSPK